MSTTLALLFLTISQQFNLPPGLLSAVCYVESNHNFRAINFSDGNSDSIGGCQLHLASARDMGYKGTAKGLLDPEVNAYYAAAYLDYQRSRYGGDVISAVSAYNVGTYRTRNGHPVNATYVRKVLKAWADHK